ncbi:hypothetical protein C8R47DRAFT_668572 [Mycena vitilis]|nr:hypothetical protein C8R47DRAFT_668572 [Mycena vitilis]
MSELITITYCLADKRHRPSKSSASTGSKIEIASAAVGCDLMRRIQTHHRDLYLSGICTNCEGLLLFEKAYVVDADAFQKIGMQGTRPLQHLTHNAEGLDVQLLQLEKVMSEYGDLRQKCIIVEGSFDRTISSNAAPPPSTGLSQTIKRAYEAGNHFDNEAHSPSKRHKLLVPEHIFVNEPESSEIPWTLSFPSPSSSFVDWLGIPGIAFVDKSRYFRAIDAFLQQSKSWISSRPSTGRTNLLCMLGVFYDRRRPHGADVVISRLHVGQEATENPASGIATRQRRSVCLMLDLGNLHHALNTNGPTIHDALNLYMCETLHAFALKYSAELGAGFTLPPPAAVDNYKLIYHKIMKVMHSKGITLFVGIDNFDDLILKSLTISDPQNRVMLTWLGKAVLALNGFLTVFINDTRIRLLVISTFPHKWFTNSENEQKLQDISDDQQVQRAFGINEVEFSGLARVVVRDDEAERELREKFCGLSKGTLNSCNLNLALHYMALSHDTNNAHKEPPRFRLLFEIAKIQQNTDLLTYLQRVKSVGLDVSTAIPKLDKFLRDAQTFWRVLDRLDLVTTVPQTQLPGKWGLAVTNSFVAARIFRGLSTSGRRLSPLEIQMRAFLEGNPSPLVEALLKTLCQRSLFELVGMSENSFQLMLDLHIGHLKNHVSQLALMTDYKMESGKAAAPGRARYGRADAFTFALSHLLPRAAVITELKYLNLSGLLYTYYPDYDKWKRATNRPESLQWICDRLDRKSTAQILQMKYTQYHAGEGYVTQTIQEILDEAIAQLESYLRAVIMGEAQDALNPKAAAQRNGIRPEVELRVAVEDGADSVVGIVMIGIGHRCILTHVLEREKTDSKYETTSWTYPTPNLG